MLTDGDDLLRQRFRHGHPLMQATCHEVPSLGGQQNHVGALDDLRQEPGAHLGCRHGAEHRDGEGDGGGLEFAGVDLEEARAVEAAHVAVLAAVDLELEVQVRPGGPARGADRPQVLPLLDGLAQNSTGQSLYVSPEEEIEPSFEERLGLLQKPRERVEPDDMGMGMDAAEEAAADFHARFSATGRHYLFRILNRRAPAARFVEVPGADHGFHTVPGVVCDAVCGFITGTT